MRPAVSGLLSCRASTILSSVSPTSRIVHRCNKSTSLRSKDPEGRLIETPAVIRLQVQILNRQVFSVRYHDLLTRQIVFEAKLTWPLEVELAAQALVVSADLDKVALHVAHLIEIGRHLLNKLDLLGVELLPRSVRLLGDGLVPVRRGLRGGFCSPAPWPPRQGLRKQRHERQLNRMACVHREPPGCIARRRPMNSAAGAPFVATMGQDCGQKRCATATIPPSVTAGSARQGQISREPGPPIRMGRMPL